MQKFKNPSLIITPMLKEDLDENDPVCFIFRNKNGEMEVEFDLKDSFLDETIEEKSIFYNGGSDLQAAASLFKDRPVYKVQLSNNKTIEGYNIINKFDIKLSEVLNGSFIVSNLKQKENETDKETQMSR